MIQHRALFVAYGPAVAVFALWPSCRAERCTSVILGKVLSMSMVAKWPMSVNLGSSPLLLVLVRGPARTGAALK